MWKNSVVAHFGALSWHFPGRLWKTTEILIYGGLRFEPKTSEYEAEVVST
jgi:hypothetical protein